MAPRILGLITALPRSRPLPRPAAGRTDPSRQIRPPLGLCAGPRKALRRGDGDACDAIAQLDGFAKSLEQKRARRAKAAELLRAAGPPSVATAPATPAPASTAANFAPTPQPDSVEAALIRLFDSYDQTKSGAVALDAFTSRWVSERMRTGVPRTTSRARSGPGRPGRRARARGGSRASSAKRAAA